MSKDGKGIFDAFRSVAKDRTLLSCTVAGIGALGQAFLLRHELVDCYPYKVMSFPSADFYQRIAAFGLFLSPGLSLVSALFIGQMRKWLVGTIPVIFCPLVFSGVFMVMTLLRTMFNSEELGRNFDDYQEFDVALGFVFYSLRLSAAGLLFGCVSTFLISLIYRKERPL